LALWRLSFIFSVNALIKISSKSDIPSTELISMLTSLWFVDRRVPVENAGPICWEHSFLSIVLQNQPML